MIGGDGRTSSLVVDGLLAEEIYLDKRCAISVFAVPRFYQLTGSHFMVMVLFEIVVLLVEPRA